MKKKIILFDIDGTIMNLKIGIAYNIFVDTLNEVFSIGIDYKNLPTFHGKTDLQILCDIEIAFGLEHNLLCSRSDQLWALLYDKFSKIISNENTVLLPGVQSLIDKFHYHEEYALGLVTGNFKENAYLKLRAQSLDSFFPVGAFGCDSASRNDLPRIALDRASEIGLIGKYHSPKASLIIGDTLNDVACAKHNNIPVLAVATGGISREVLQSADPEMYLDDLADTDSVFEMIDNYLNRENL